MGLALSVGLAGASGAVARYLIDGAVQDRSSGVFPLGTLTVNLIGSLLFGVVAGVALHHVGFGTARTLIGTGICGGLTTWSTASWETVRLAEEGSGLAALSFTLVNLLLGLAAGGLGMLVGLA
jgi:CrcB protein